MRCATCDRDLEEDYRGRPVCFPCRASMEAFDVIRSGRALTAEDRLDRDASEIKDAMKAKGVKP